ncbi:sigma-70 family RNA polymerase sigma factor [Rhodoplanes sp. Z2-YC6860]|uniref:sigma-70 family RNA polymerase sigma factor n=1 Tax=Rhodoplanes sp. Z2-YC6860 TaxID=674703 RepID=UPI00078E123A|nr:sigma-70 family RNA polymerase sigma factor [Rhodoplanes sp. Z2-YC6860]AMN45502.1 ECF subfamily RNA polymerase sigma-24 subunit [Rhodoplanes sp. Z2-YC6860]
MGVPSVVDPGRSLDAALGELRPKLHRFCARMTGSAIDGEDIVQEVCVKAIEAAASSGPIDNVEGWLFRIAHNAALDFLRRRNRQGLTHSDEATEMIADPSADADRLVAAAASLRAFMELTAIERSAVILMDVLGYHLDEIGFITGSSIPSIKAALHRGRGRLRELASTPDERPWPALSAAESARLSKYVALFNARDFDAIRDMLADDVRLELVNHHRMKGKEVANYFGNYAKISNWHLTPGQVDGRPAVLVRESADPAAKPSYLIVLEWSNGKIVNIRDFRYARYVVESAAVTVLPS